MRVRMLVSLMEMPSFTPREEGGFYQVDEVTGHAWVAARLAVPVIDGPETASVQGGGEQAVTAKASRKRG